MINNKLARTIKRGSKSLCQPMMTKVIAISPITNCNKNIDFTRCLKISDQSPYDSF